MATDAHERFCLGDLAESDFRVDFVEFFLFRSSLALSGALGFDEFHDFHGGFETSGGGGVFITQQVSKSVDCEVGEIGELVEEAVGFLLAGVEEGAGEVRVLTGPEVDGGPVDAGFLGGGGDGGCC